MSLKQTNTHACKGINWLSLSWCQRKRKEGIKRERHRDGEMTGRLTDCFDCLRSLWKDAIYSSLKHLSFILVSLLNNLKAGCILFVNKHTFPSFFLFSILPSRTAWPLWAKKYFHFLNAKAETTMTIAKISILHSGLRKKEQHDKWKSEQRPLNFSYHGSYRSKKNYHVTAYEKVCFVRKNGKKLYHLIMK
jgi:hypothetical protein